MSGSHRDVGEDLAGRAWLDLAYVASAACPRS